MPVDRCRVCGSDFFKKPLLRYANMPGAAQHLPDAASLARDRGIDLEVCQCSGCGLVQLSNDPVPYYREVIRAAAVSDEMLRLRREQFGRFVRDFSLSGKRVVEIGCGRGEYLSVMAQCGVEAFGLEGSEEAARRCAESGLRVEKGFAESGFRAADGPFDGFFILNFLEHIPDPNAALRAIAENLAPGGTGLVEVPNFDMIVQKNLFSEFVSDHLFYFTKETLTATLARNGFEIVDCREIWYDYIISATVKKRTPTDLSPFRLMESRLKENVLDYVRRFEKVAVWGAGHQALALIAILDLAGRIAYVVDSARFKQGKYTPATHLPIVAPESLRSNPVDAVIVMAAGYSDEVAKILRQEFDAIPNICIMRDFGLEPVKGLRPEGMQNRG
ncbi:MAG: class I SAM-dependent methyltransferase [Desulfobacteraceae bacterium]|nr:class I SAM-dependent methyltransferase [Desulfobacteraceae bacterium]